MAGRRMLTDQDREEICRGIAAGEGQKQIAARTGRGAAWWCREIARYGGRGVYRAGCAGQARSRPKPRKLDADLDLRQQVTGLLMAGCSPDQVAGRLRYLAGRCQGGAMPSTVSAEAIYCWIYAPTNGEPAAVMFFSDVVSY